MQAHDPGKTPDTKRGRSPAPLAALPAPAVRYAGNVSGMSPASILALQRSAGNAAVSHMLEQARRRHGPGCGHQLAPVQRSAVHDVLASSGQPLDRPLKEEMEARLGADFSDV